MKASPRKVPARRAAAIIASASGAETAIGFSQSTCLPASGGPDRPFGMRRVRRCDVDRLDLGIAEDRLVAGMDARAGKSLGQSGLFGVAARDRHKPAGPRMRQGVGKCLGDDAGADDAPAYGSAG